MQAARVTNKNLPVKRRGLVKFDVCSHQDTNYCTGWHMKIHVNVPLVYTDQGPCQRQETRRSSAEGVNIWLIFAYVYQTSKFLTIGVKPTYSHASTSAAILRHNLKQSVGIKLQSGRKDFTALKTVSVVTRNQ